MDRTVIVPAASPLLDHPGTKKLHAYPNGEVLVSTSAPAVEAVGDEPPNETAFESGLILPTTRAGEATELPTPAEVWGDLAGKTVLAYVRFHGPVDEAWLKQLRTAGVAPVRPQPRHSYLCRGTPETFAAAAKLPVVAQVVPLTDKLKSAAIVAEAGDTLVTVVLVGTADEVPAVVERLKKLEGVTPDGKSATHLDGKILVRAKVTGTGRALILREPTVVALELYHPPKAEGEVAALIVAGQYTAGVPHGSYLGWLAGHGLSGAGVTIGVVDTGVDVRHAAFTGRIADHTGGSRSWHGTFVASCAAGRHEAEKDANGFILALGVAPAAHITSFDWQVTTSEVERARRTVTTAGPNGVPATIQNNSWGAGAVTPMGYGAQEATFDSLVRNADPGGTGRPLTVCFSAGNSGELGLTRPKGAKNLLVVGNSENYLPDRDDAADQSDNINEVYSGPDASSHGVCGDGRVRPHVVAPGQWTTAANFGRKEGDRSYISATAAYGHGTSAASPKVAGGCAVLTEWWRKANAGDTPSPALLRALVVNTAVDTRYGGSVPNKHQGWGRVHLQAVLDPSARRVYVDQTTLLRNRGDRCDTRATVADPTRPLRVTLAWTDPPGSEGSGTATLPCVVNRLVLLVETAGGTYRGNVFTGGSSVLGGSPARDGLDNVQNVFLPAGVVSGPFTVRVQAVDITTNCLTNQPDGTAQDFALVIDNATPLTEGGGVLAVIDPKAGASGATTPADHLEGPPTTTTTQPASTSSSTPADADAWWAESTLGAAVEGGEPANGGYDPVTDVSVGLRAVAGTVPARVLQPTTGAESEGEQATPAVVPDSADTARAAVATAATIPFRAALAAAWRAVQSATRPHTVLLWVGAGTRFTAADLATLRALAFHCRVVVVSTAASVLQFLAEQLGPLPGLSLRAATDSPTEAVHSTVVEAAGGQVVVTTDQTGAIPRKVSFTVSNLDERIVVFVRNPQAVVTVSRPSGVADPAPRIEPVADGGRLLTFEKAAGGPWAGGWQLTLTADGQVRVWAFGSLRLRLAGAGWRAKGRLSVGVFGGQLTDVMVESRPLTVKATESSTEVVTVRARPSPLLDGEPAVEAADPPTAPRLDVVLPKHADVPAADLTVSVSGRDATGVVFRRRVWWTHPLLGRWARPSANGKRRLTVSAELTEAHYSGGQLTGVTVRNGRRERELRVTSPALREQLAVVAGPSPRPVLIDVIGDELLGVVHLLAPAVVPPPNGPSHGIDHPVPDRPQAESPDPDYPQASRYVQAKHYRAVADTRGVSRVVIHITDGGPKVDGTVGWFLNPTKPNGDPLPVSAHYVIGQNGDVVQMVRNNDIAYHAGSANGDSVGIEHCARQPRAFGPTDSGLTPSMLQYEASAALVRWLCEGYGIPMDREHILGHSEADTHTTHTACPNSVWDWEYFMELVTSGMSQPPPR